MFDQDLYNKGIQERGKKLEGKLRSKLSQLGIGQTGQLMNSLRVTYKKSYGDINAIGITLTKGGVMVEKGVGRGVPIDSAKTNADLFGGRVAKPWFNPVMDSEIPDLADFISSQNADQLVNALKIK